MIPASVGFQCPEEVRAANRTRRTWRTQFGGRTTGDPGYVTKLLIAVNVAVFVLQQIPGLGVSRRFWLIGEAFDPALGAVGVASGEPYRLLTAAFLHGGLAHIAFNMMALVLFGPTLEGAFGRVRYLTLYLVSALGGTAASYALGSPLTPSLGASGAVFGLFGALLVVNRRLGRESGGLWVLLALNLALGLVVPTIDWRAHVGGLVAGAVVAVAVVYAPRAARALWQWLGLAAVVAVELGLVALRTAQLAG
jgi:membrane associated rhomboid family serine protease